MTDMRTTNFFKYALTALLMLFTICTKAQTNGDKLFMQGQTLQRTQTVAAQNQAIKKFRAAKIVYATSEKKKMCDNQISICNSNIASLKRAPAPTSRSRSTSSRSKSNAPSTVSVEKESPFVVGDEDVSFTGDKAATYNVAVIAPNNDWDFNVSSGLDGEDDFAKVKRGDDGESLDINVPANPKTLPRHQTMRVSASGQTKTVNISQEGKPVTLSSSDNLLEFKSKGGNKTIEIYTNSDSVISDNNNITWYIESKPEWVETNVEVRKEKSIFGKGLNAIKGLVKATATAANAEDVKTYNVKITVRGLHKTDEAFKTGRKGDIILASQNKRYTIGVRQEGED